MRLLGVQLVEQNGDLLAVGQQPHHVKDLGPLEVKPAAWEPLHPDAAKPRNADQLTDPWRPDTRHLLDRPERRDSSIEEPGPELRPTGAAMVASPRYEVGLGQGPQLDGLHPTESNAR